jgi:hypothetical protein
MNDWSAYDEKVLKVFDKFRFRTLRKRAENLNKKIVKENQGKLF